MSDKDFEVLQTALSPEVSESEEQVCPYRYCILNFTSFQVYLYCYTTRVTYQVVWKSSRPKVMSPLILLGVNSQRNEVEMMRRNKRNNVRYRVFSLTWPASVQIYWNKRKRLRKKRVQLSEDWFGTATWPPFHCFGTPIWPPWRHVKTLYLVLQSLDETSLGLGSVVGGKAKKTG